MKTLKNLISSSVLSASMLFWGSLLVLWNEATAIVETTKNKSENILKTDFSNEIENLKSFDFMKKYWDYNTFIDMVEKNEIDWGFSNDDKRTIFSTLKCVNENEADMFLKNILNWKNITSKADLEYSN